MKPIWSILLITNLFGQEPLTRTLPKAKIPFELNYYDIRSAIHMEYVGGRVDVEFTIDENGDVINPVILDTFDIYLNDVVLDKVKQSKYYPATQNGRPIKVKYKLPIVFK